MSAEEFINKLFGKLPELFKDEGELRKLWSRPDTRRALMEGLAERGFGDEQLAEVARMVDAEDADLFDVLAYIAYAKPPVSRVERVARRQRRILESLDTEQRAFLIFVLDHYVQRGVGELDDRKLPQLLQLRYRSLFDASRELGGNDAIRNLFVGFQEHLYERQVAA